VVRPEFQAGQIAELSRPMQQPSGVPESTGKKSARIVNLL